METRKAKFKHFIGIDVSKGKIDVWLCVNFGSEGQFWAQFEQSKKGFSGFKKWLQSHIGKDMSSVFACLENTGLYDDATLYFLADHHIAACLENGATIKAAKRDQRQKNDKLDAREIAMYAIRYLDEVEIWEKPREIIEQLKQLLSLRSSLIEHLKGLKQRQKEIEGFKWARIQKIKDYTAGAKGLQKDIEGIEKAIWELIKNDAALLKMYALITSIPAVGKITAWHFICYTNEFKRVKSGKTLSAYCGVVPFKEDSGTSIRKPPRLPNRANLILKTLLHLCAMTAIKMKGEFAAYYQKKIAEGKHVLKALNSIKNKLVLRIAAVIKNEMPYDEHYDYKSVCSNA
jgi:transposase